VALSPLSFFGVQTLQFVSGISMLSIALEGKMTKTEKEGLLGCLDSKVSCVSECFR
jgi:hypothetical protein